MPGVPFSARAKARRICGAGAGDIVAAMNDTVGADSDYPQSPVQVRCVRCAGGGQGAINPPSPLRIEAGSRRFVADSRPNTGHNRPRGLDS
jgi:hypothetical protein